jgi:hypothetical protein
MPARLAAGLLVSALIRRAEAAGGHGTVIARGDRDAGSILIQLAERGVAGPLLERQLGPDGLYRWSPAGPEGADERSAYLARRRQRDPDLWVIELDVSEGRSLVEGVAG